MLIPNRSSNPFQIFVKGAYLKVPVVNCRQSPRSRPTDNIFFIALLSITYKLIPIYVWRKTLCKICPWIKAVSQARLVGDIRGGDSFSDIYGVRNFVLASIPTISVLWIRGSVVLFPQTYGPYRHRLSKWVARFILNRASPILSRDRESMNTVRELIGGKANIQFCPDVAFSLAPVSPRTIAAIPPLIAGEGGVLVGLNVNGLMYNGGYTRRNMFGLTLDYREFLKLLVRSILDIEKSRILLVPHTFAPFGDVESDPEACQNILNAVGASGRNRIHLVNRSTINMKSRA